MSTTSYEEDVRFIGAFARGGKWEIALRIARRVEVGIGNGRPPKTAAKSGGFHERHSMAQIARDSGLTEKTVQKYLATWEWAASDGLVDHSADLDLDAEYDWELSNIGQHEWNEYYDTAMLNPPPWRPQGKPLEPRLGPDRHVAKEDAAVTPEKAAAAIEEDPEVEKAAIKAINRKYEKRAKERRERVINKMGPANTEPLPESGTVLDEAVSLMEASVEETKRRQDIRELQRLAADIKAKADALVSDHGYTGVEDEIEWLHDVTHNLSEASWALTGFIVEKEDAK